MIDARTLRALEYGKVLEHLAAFCVSAAGQEAVRALHPLETADAAREAGEMLDEARTWAALNRPGGNTAPGRQRQDTSLFRMEAFPDISPVLHVARRPAAMLDPDALWALREILRLARRAASSLRGEDAGRLWPHLLALLERYPLPQRTLPALERCLGDDGQLKDESSPELLLVRTEVRRLHQTCMRKVRDFALQYNILTWLQDEFMTLASDRYVLPLKANVKGRLQGIIHDWSQTGETCYFEPMANVCLSRSCKHL